MLPYVWGSTEAEVAAPYPCDGLLTGPVVEIWRAVDTTAPPAAVYRWLCQLRYAPYSYDLVDNLGRRSPRRLIPGSDELVVGMRMATVFTLASYEPGRQVTIAMTGRAARVLGESAISYVAAPGRLAAKLVVRRRPGVALLAWGDLPMMRKQLRTLTRLAERTEG